DYSCLSYDINLSGYIF
nr:immunoglobulin light chain junction region [Macaca mulatta]